MKFSVLYHFCIVEDELHRKNYPKISSFFERKVYLTFSNDEWKMQDEHCAVSLSRIHKHSMIGLYLMS